MFAYQILWTIFLSLYWIRSHLASRPRAFSSHTRLKYVSCQQKPNKTNWNYVELDEQLERVKEGEQTIISH